MRALSLLCLFAVASSATAQVQGAATKAPATKTQTPAANTQAPATKAAAPGAKTQTPAIVTKQAAPTTTKQTPAAAPTTTKQTPSPATKTGAATANTQTKGAAAAPAARRPALTVAPESIPAPKIPVIMREVFDYDAAGRRDPFVSLLSTTELRPTVADLRLVIVLFDETGRRPVAVMRDLTTNTQYRVTTGMTLGRMRVAQIKRRSVIFSIEEFGLNRQDSLVLGDTTKTPRTTR